jgi:putative transposase
VRYGVIEQMRQQYPVPRCAGSWVCPPAVTMHGAKGLPRCALSKSPGTKRKYVPLTSVPERPLVRNGYRRSWLSAASRSVFTGSSVCARSSAFVCKQKRKFKATTNSTHNLPVAPNILDQDFSASEPNQAWCGDITYIATDEGWLYLAGLKDLFSGALLRRPVELAHYCAHAYQKLVKQFGMEASKSRRGNCYDNVPIESFWGLLKNELVYYRKFATRAQAQKEITEYIEIFYNRQRTQERLNYLSPAAFTQRFHLNKIAA